MTSTAGQRCCLLVLLACLSGSVLGQAETDAAPTEEDARELRRLAEEAEIAKMQAELDKITRLDNPTRVQYAEYILALRAYNKLATPPLSQIEDRLAVVPVEHTDLLLAESAAGTILRYAARERLKALEADEAMLRPQIAANLENTPNHIGMIVTYGWCEDVRDIITEKVLAAKKSLDPDSQYDLFWFAAAAELKEPKLYKKLHELTVDSVQAPDKLRVLQAIPDYDYLYTLRAVLKRAEDGRLQVRKPVDYNTELLPELRYAAAQNGDVEALGKMIDAVRSQLYYYDSWKSYQMHRLPVLTLIDHRGSSADIKAWFKENRDKLVYDGLRKRFVLPDDES